MPGEEKLFGRLKTQVMKPSCRLFGHSQAPSGILEDTSLNSFCLKGFTVKKRKRVRVSSQHSIFEDPPR